MYTIEIDIRCIDSFFEVPLDDPENAELTIEDLVSCALVDLFEAIIVGRVIISVFPGSRMDVQICSISIVVQRPGGPFLLIPEELENMEFAVEDTISCIFLELFETVIVDRVTISLSSSDDEDDSSLPRSA